MKNDKAGNLKETIVTESIRLFLINGFSGTSVKQITEAVGISRGGLYWYFKSKEEIHIAIFRKFETELLDKLSEAVRECDGDFPARFKLFNKYATEFARDNRDLSLAYNTLLSEISFTDTPVEKVAKSVHAKFHLIVKEMLDHGKRDGSVGSGVDSDIYAHAIIACHMGMLDQWLIAGDSMDVPAFVKAVRGFILQGITNRED